MWKSGVALGLMTSVAVTVWVLLHLHGWEYYRTPIVVRGYAPGHQDLRPSGPFGQTFGVIGAAMILVPFLYMLRKRLVRWTWAGRLKIWLEVHLFCGIVGPVIVTFHTAFKFNGIVSAAYWSMVLVALSGFVGRYLYVRIPRSIRGTELSRVELDERAEELRLDLVEAVGAGAWLEKVKAFEAAASPQADGRTSFAGLLFGDVALRFHLRALGRELRTSPLVPAAQHELRRLLTDRLVILRRIAYLQKTKSAFGLWHVFHVPLVYLLLVILAVHVSVTLYMGYVPFRW